MKILKTLIEEFDKTEYTDKDVKSCKNNEKVTLKGFLTIEEKTTRAKKPYYNLTITDESGKISSAIWQNDSLFDFLDVAIDNDKCVEINGEVTINKFKNIKINNLSILETDETETEDDKILNIDILYTEFEQRLNLISNEYLKRIVSYILDFEELKNFKNIPFSEKTAYNYSGGLMHQIIDSCDMVSALCDSINCGFWKHSTILNEDLLFTGAIISNLGKAITLQVDENGIVSKTFKGKLDEDSVYSRFLADKAISKVLEEIKEEDNSKYEIYEKLFTELLHMVASIKNNVNWGALSTPRSKHALMLSHINNLVYTKGLFENLEKNNLFESEFSKPYDNGKSYFLGNKLE